MSKPSPIAPPTTYISAPKPKQLSPLAIRPRKRTKTPVVRGSTPKASATRSVNGGGSSVRVRFKESVYMGRYLLQASCEIPMPNLLPGLIGSGWHDFTMVTGQVLSLSVSSQAQRLVINLSLY